MAQRLEIEYDGDDENLGVAVAHAVTILNSDTFLNVIADRATKFYHTKRACRDIAQQIRSASATIKIVMFDRGPLPNGNIVTGYADADNPDIIYYNKQALKRSVKAMTNTLVHEAVHIVDKFHDINSYWDFTHNGNKPTPKNQQSAPYWIGNRAEDLAAFFETHRHAGDKAMMDGMNADSVRDALTDQDWSGDECHVCPSGD